MLAKPLRATRTSYLQYTSIFVLTSTHSTNNVDNVMTNTKSIGADYRRGFQGVIIFILDTQSPFDLPGRAH